MPELTALKSFTYAGKALTAGAGFVASRQDARVLVAVRSASYSKTTEETGRATPDSTQDAADSAGASPQAKKSGRQKKG